MIYTYPDYYKSFRCIAGDCPDTCCAGWQIVIDEEALSRYKMENGPYQPVLHKRIDWEESVFHQDQAGNCAFLRKDLLCDMYVHLGEKSLCRTCREYPRHTEEFENLREVSLALSCPEAAKLILRQTEPVTFVSKEEGEEEFWDDFDAFLFSVLAEIRVELIRILQNRELPIRARIKSILKIAGSAMRHYEEGSVVFWDEMCDEDDVWVEDEYSFLQEVFARQYELEYLYPDREKILKSAETILFEREDFTVQKEAFEQWWEQSSLVPIDILLEQILVYFIFSYFHGAVYDENISGKVDACAAHAIEIYLMLFAKWLENGSLTEADIIFIVYRYSREIENSDENLVLTEEFDWFHRWEGFEDGFED